MAVTFGIGTPLVRHQSTLGPAFIVGLFSFGRRFLADSLDLGLGLPTAQFRETRQIPAFPTTLAQTLAAGRQVLLLLERLRVADKAELATLPQSKI